MAAEEPDGSVLPMPQGLILENAFTSIKEMAVQLFPFLAVVKPLLRPPLLWDEWKASESIDFLIRNYQDWSCCLLSGLQDQIVPPAQMRQYHSILKERRPKILKMFVFKYGGHND